MAVSIHHQNLQKLAVEMFKVSRGLSPEIVNELFQFKEQISYELRPRSLVVSGLRSKTKGSPG